MLPYIVGVPASALVVVRARARTTRQLYLFTRLRAVRAGVAGQGPGGLALPAIVLVGLPGACARPLARRSSPHARDPARRRCCSSPTAFPWYHAMLIRHGMGFWNEFIGDNYVHRAGGRHGDRGTFEYYLQ